MKTQPLKSSQASPGAPTVGEAGYFKSSRDMFYLSEVH